MASRRQRDNWAEQVPWTRPQTPYRDYGWEDESVLPEFRDPSVHVMPYERERVSRWRREGQDMTVIDWTEPGPFTGMGPKGYQRSDERIREDVCERLTQHGHIDASQIDVSVAKGEVTLEGVVEDRQQKRLAEDTIETITGIKDIHNHLHIAPEQFDNRMDRVGRSGVYPASARSAPGDSQAQGMASWGQGERGAAGYNDSGQSELPTRAEQPRKGSRKTNR